MSTYICFLHAAQLINTLRPRQNGRRFEDKIFKRIFLNGNLWILHKISLKYVPQGLMDNIAALVQIMAWRQTGGKPYIWTNVGKLYWRRYASVSLNELSVNKKTLDYWKLQMLFAQWTTKFHTQNFKCKFLKKKSSLVPVMVFCLISIKSVLKAILIKYERTIQEYAILQLWNCCKKFCLKNKIILPNPQ